MEPKQEIIREFNEKPYETVTKRVDRGFGDEKTVTEIKTIIHHEERN